MKLGTGSLTLTGALGYDGNTTVNGGTLNLSDLNTPAATVFVADGAILTAHSIVADTLTIGGTGGGAAMATAVPEPGVFVLLAMAVLSAFLTWRRK
jgi:autotransporter-associated beta strand protein